MDLPWNSSLSDWQPFRIDALGLVTLLGADEINSSIGRLVSSRYLEYFPLLGAFVILGERFKEKIPSFNFYNITDGINTTDLSFWLTRWMLEQDFEATRSVVHFEVSEQPRPYVKWYITSGLLSFVFVGFLVGMTFLIGDWYGFANAIAMALSIVARAYQLQVHRNAIDEKVKIATKNGKQIDVDKKCLMIMSDSKAVTLHLPGNLVVPVFIYNPEPKHSVTYHLMRYFGWVVFGVHIITIGMATLLPQIYTVFLLVISTVLVTWKLGCDDSKWKTKFDRRILRRPPRPTDYYCWIGTRLRAHITEWPVETEFRYLEQEKRWTCQPKDKVMAPEERSKKRQDLYAWLNLSPEEEDSLAKWDLFPHNRGNRAWWETYKAKQLLIRNKPLDATRAKQKDDTVVSEIDKGREQPASESGNETDEDAISSSLHPSERSSLQLIRRPVSTWLTSNGFVVQDRPSVTAAVHASMSAIGLRPGPNDVPLGPISNRRGYNSERGG